TARIDLDPSPVGEVAGAELTVGSEVDPHIDPATEVDEKILRDALVVVVDILDGSGSQPSGLDKEPLRGIERLVQAGEEVGRGTELHPVAPLRAVLVEPGAYVLYLEL